MYTYFIHMGDNHAGLENGLIAPGTKLKWGQDDYREQLLSGWSEWLWHEVWLPGLEKVKKLSGEDPVYLLHSGDVVHGSRFVESLYTPFINHQVQIAVRSLKPVREIPGFAGIALVNGTGSHDYGNNSASDLVTEKLVNWGYPVWHGDHLELNFEGYRMDIAHHGSYVSKIDHLRENTARRDTKQLMMRDIEWGRPPINLYQRGHVHMPINIVAEVVWRNQRHAALGVITPPMCGPNGYARQATRSMQDVTCGFYVTIVDSSTNLVVGQIDWLKSRDTRDYHQIKVELPYHKRKKDKDDRKGKNRARKNKGKKSKS